MINRIFKLSDSERRILFNLVCDLLEKADGELYNHRIYRGKLQQKIACNKCSSGNWQDICFGDKPKQFFVWQKLYLKELNLLKKKLTKKVKK